MRLLVILLGLWLVLAAMPPARAEGLPPTVPGRLAARLVANPDAVAAAVSDLIHGFGDGVAVDRAAIARSVAMDRARARARALLPVLAADLDGDGQVAADEGRAVAAAAPARARGQLVRALQAADADSDGTILADEAFRWAEGQARLRIDAEDEARLMAYLTLDLNGDGRLMLDEVAQAADAAQKAAKLAKAGAGDDADA